MKHIFLILTLTVLSLISVPKTALATIGQSCCPSGYQYVGCIGFGFEGCYLNGNCNSARVTYTCAATIETCNTTTKLCVAATKPPSCPPGYDDRTVGGTCDYCCTWDSLKPWEACIWATKPLGFAYSCDYLKANAAQKAPKTACPDKLFSKYDPALKVCTNPTNAQTLWDLQNRCENGTVGIQSAIGCIQTGDLKEFLAFLMRFVIGISGAIILIMLVLTGYNVLTSAGNPEKLAAAKENLLALIGGLILIVFSLVLLHTIGVDILKLPGF